MSIDCVILDFDGTFTNVEVEAAPYVVAFRRAVADILGAEAEALWDSAEAEIYAAPNRYGWLHEGKIVAPALADPYIRCTVATHLICERLGRLRDPKLKTALSTLLYTHSYAHTAESFRPHAKEVMEQIVSRYPGRVFVVTNSATDTVKGKIEGLSKGLTSRLRVEGNARKFMLEELSKDEAGAEMFDSLPAEKHLEALPERPLMLRRGFYFRILQKLWAETGAKPANTLVCGDIYELDLALPEALGARVHLLTRPNTPAYEIAAATARGAATGDLRDLLSYL